MDKIISKAALEARRIKFKPGTRVELVSMNDPYTTLKPGDRGTVSEVDDIGTVFVNWDNGSTLGCCYGADEIKVVPYLSDKVFEEIMVLRKLPNCPNMFDIKAVFELAIAHDFNELADFVFSETACYSAFILTGERS
jgi:hypothetical protein